MCRHRSGGIGTLGVGERPLGLWSVVVIVAHLFILLQHHPDNRTSPLAHFTFGAFYSQRPPHSRLSFVAIVLFFANVPYERLTLSSVHSPLVVLAIATAYAPRALSTGDYHMRAPTLLPVSIFCQPLELVFHPFSLEDILYL